MRWSEVIVACLLFVLTIGSFMALVDHAARKNERKKMHKQIKLECLQEISREAAARNEKRLKVEE